MMLLLLLLLTSCTWTEVTERPEAECADSLWATTKADTTSVDTLRWPIEFDAYVRDWETDSAGFME